jgi:3-dehydrosphinganine reductase
MVTPHAAPSHLRRPGPSGTPAWHNKHVIITGGSQGIGAALARAIAARSARVSLIARGEPALRDTAHRTGADWATADVTDTSQLAAAIHGLESDHGAVDVLVCCAGIVVPGRFDDLSTQEIAYQMTVNYLGSVNAVHTVLPGMVERSSGRIVLTSSAAGLLGVVGYTGYGPTKAAIRHYALALRYELESTGVTVSVVYPPDTDTPGFATESRRRPPETAAIAGTIAPIPAHRVADAIIRGVERGKPHIAIDPLTKFLTFWVGAPENAARPLVNRLISRAQTEGRR